jgi:hypothetical protein
MLCSVGLLFHVSSRRNRESILEHGLDWRLMSDAPGIAGNNAPEVAGVFLCVSRLEADFFIRMNNTGGPVDLWQVKGVNIEQLLDAGSGYLYLPCPVDVASLELTVDDVQPPVRGEQTFVGASEAYSSELTIRLD